MTLCCYFSHSKNARLTISFLTLTFSLVTDRNFCATWLYSSWLWFLIFRQNCSYLYILFFPYFLTVYDWSATSTYQAPPPLKYSNITIPRLKFCDFFHYSLNSYTNPSWNYSPTFFKRSVSMPSLLGIFNFSHFEAQTLSSIISRLSLVSAEWCFYFWSIQECAVLFDYS